MRKLKMLFLRLRNKLKYFLHKNISSKAYLSSNVQIFGLDNILIHDGCVIGDNTLLTVNNRKNNNIQLVLGYYTYIGRDNFFSVGRSIVIGDYCIFGNKCSFICSDHIFNTPLLPYALTGNSFEKAIKIGVNCWLGHDVCILGNVTIGHGCVIGAKTLITKDIPPFSMVVGNPAKIIKTFNFQKDTWEEGANFQPSIYDDEDIYLSYLNELQKKPPINLYSASSKYGHI
ncbi:acyltransferase [Pedobacter sp.]